MSSFGKIGIQTRKRKITLSIGLGSTGVAGALAFFLHTAEVPRSLDAPPKAQAPSKIETREQPLTGSFSTQLGEHRVVLFPGGLHAHLNSNTTVVYTFDQHHRQIEVSPGGEAAFFQDTLDNRPLEVDGGALTAGGLSGNFDVDRRRDAVQVTVLDGDIKVTPTAAIGGTSGLGWAAVPTYHPLQQIRFDLTTNKLLVRKLTEPRLTQQMSWQRGRIDITDLTVRQALNEFARYQSIRLFQFQDPSLAAIRVEGDLDSTDLMSFLTYLKNRHNIESDITVTDGNSVVKLWRKSERPSHSIHEPATESKAVAGVAWRES